MKETISIEEAGAAEDRLRFLGNLLEGFLVTAGTAVGSAAVQKQPPETEKALRKMEKAIDTCCKIIREDSQSGRSKPWN